MVKKGTRISFGNGETIDIDLGLSKTVKVLNIGLQDRRFIEVGDEQSLEDPIFINPLQVKTVEPLKQGVQL